MTLFESLVDAISEGTTMAWAVAHGEDSVAREWATGRDANGMIALVMYLGIAYVDVFTSHRGLPDGTYVWCNVWRVLAPRSTVRVRLRDGREIEDENGDMLGTLRAAVPSLTLADVLRAVAANRGR